LRGVEKQVYRVSPKKISANRAKTKGNRAKSRLTIPFFKIFTLFIFNSFENKIDQQPNTGDDRKSVKEYY